MYFLSFFSIRFNYWPAHFKQSNVGGFQAILLIKILINLFILLTCMKQFAGLWEYFIPVRLAQH